jgi:hypothetical protein
MCFSAIAQTKQENITNRGKNQRKNTQDDISITLNCPVSPTLNSKEPHVHVVQLV